MRLGLALLICFCLNPAISYELDGINYQIDNVFVVPEGYDTNDNVEVTFTTKLPNACFTPYQSSIVKQAPNEYKLNFYIKRKNISTCTDITSGQFKNPIYYTQTVSIGELAQGSYKINFNNGKSVNAESFKVDKATTSNVDNMIYAPVSNIFIPDLIYTTYDAQLILSGILQDSCLIIDNKYIDVKKYGNIFVVIPKAIVNTQVECQKIEKPLQKIVGLGELMNSGTYFIHVRSQSGLSVNKVFRVKDKEFQPSRRAGY